MRSTGILRYGALLIPAAAAVSFAATPHEPDFPIIGGLYGQPARLLVAGDGSLRCSIASEFRTGAGSPPGRTFDLTPGQTAFTDVSVSRLSGRLGDPVELLPFVKVLGGRCSASIEVIEQFTARYTTALTPEIVQGR